MPEHALPCVPEIWQLNYKSNGTLLACKKSNQKINSLLRYQKFAISKHFGHAQACLATPTQNMTMNLQLSQNFTYMQKIKTTAYVIVEILKICHFGTLWACPGVPGNTHPKYDN